MCPLFHLKPEWVIKQLLLCPVPIDFACFALLSWAPKRLLTKYRGGATIQERDLRGLSIVDPSKSGIDLEPECVIKQLLL